MNAIEVKNLVKTYKFKGRCVEAVRSISFNIKKGEIFGLLGPNGAGKSTTINILSGILSKDSGQIKIFGKDPEVDREYVRNNMNVSSAYFGLSDILTVYQNLKVYAKLYNVKDYDKRISQLLDDFELGYLKDKKATTLSSGERTRLSLCKGFINNPKVLLLDECTVGLDPYMSEKTRQLIKKYQKENKASILFTSHYMPEVEKLCDRIAFMNHGNIVKIDKSENLKKTIRKQLIEMFFINPDKKLKNFFSEKNINAEFKGKNKVLFEVDTQGHDLFRIINSLFTRGYKLKDLKINRPTLDEIFIKITKGK